MAAISTLRGTVDITHLAGDTLTISVKAPASIVDGMEWHAQVRASTGDPQILAEFDIVLPVIPGEPGFLVLAAAITGSLAPPGEQFLGVWDCQLSGPGGVDPVTTICGGKLKFVADVTRLAAA